MNDYLKTNLYRLLRVGIICSVLLVFSVVCIAVGLAKAGAATPNDATPAVTNTVTPTAVPPTPTAVPPTPTAVSPTPTAVSPTPTAVPTTQPTAAPPAPTAAPPDTVPTPQTGGIVPAPVITPTPGATPTPTSTTVASPTATHATPAASAATTNNANAATPSQSGNSDPFMDMLVPAGAVALLLLTAGGAVGWLFWQRRSNQPEMAPGIMGGGAIASRLLGRKNEPELAANGAASFQAASFASSPTVANIAPVMGPPPGSLLAGLPPVPAPAPQFPLAAPDQAYRPSALHPITNSMPAHFPDAQTMNTATYPPTSDMSPFSLDALNFATVPAPLPQVEPGNRPLTPPPVAADLMPLPITPPVPPEPAAQEMATPPVVSESRSQPPPRIKGDSMLEAIMRQAQLGLYALPGRVAREG